SSPGSPLLSACRPPFSARDAPSTAPPSSHSASSPDFRACPASLSPSGHVPSPTLLLFSRSGPHESSCAPLLSASRFHFTPASPSPSSSHPSSTLPRSANLATHPSP